MEIYFYSICLSVVLVYLINKVLSSKKSIIYWILSVIALLPTTIVAGVRDLTIGTDIKHYVVTNFLAARGYSNLFDYVSYIDNIKTAFVGAVNHTEAGYSVIVFLISRFTGDVHWLLFTLQMLTILFVYIGLVNFHNQFGISITMGLLIYDFLFFGPSLNVMRQSLAAAIVFFGVSLLLGDRIKMALFYFLVACLFHLTALISIPLIVFYLYLKKRDKKFQAEGILFGRFIILVFIFIIVYLFGARLFKGIQIVVSFIPFLSKYAPSFGVQTGYKLFGTLMFVITDFVIVGMTSFNVDSKKRGIVSSFFFGSICLTVLFYTIYKYQSVIPRLGIYFAMIRMVAYPYYLKIEKDFLMRLLISGLLVVTLIWTFIYTTQSGSGEIYPYASQILQNF
jgi:transmembrane protein EpsG